MADRDVRKAELERKKAKLAKMKLDKQRREEAKRVDPSAVVEVKKADLDQKRDETSRILEGLGLPEQAPPPAVESQRPNSPKSTDTNTSDTVDKAGVKLRQPPTLTAIAVTCHTIQPKELVLYAKETQTREIQADNDSEDETESRLQEEKENMRPEAAEENVPVAEEREGKATPPPKRVYTASEAERAECDQDFVAFFDRTTRIVERILSEPTTDFASDYTGEVGEQLHQQQTDAVSEKRIFIDEHWSKNRLCTSLDWSPQFSELCAASYHKNPNSEIDPHGIALIWNMKFAKETPEYVFHCQSPVTKAKFARFHPNLLIGGTYSGQIVIWDNRTFKKTPVQRTKLGASAHTHPVYCLDVIGSQNAHNVISVSTDGKLCSWSLDMLSKPQDFLELTAKQSRPVSVTSLAFPGDSVNNFILGSEDGLVYAGQRHGNKKPGIAETYEKHGASVTGLDCHRAQSKLDFSHLFLTSSFDWTVKLWSTKAQTPLYSFENFGAYVLDVGWSPIHPALFSAVDLTGKLSFWNLNTDTEVPISSTVAHGGKEALNSLSWHNSGTMIATGSQNGRVSIFELGDAIAQPAVDESSRLNQTLNEIYARLEESQPAAKSVKRYDL